MRRMDYKQLMKKYGTPTNVAMLLGFCRENSTKKRKAGAVARVCNWKRTDIPAKQLARLEAIENGK